jgi:hypothetical protein
LVQIRVDSFPKLFQYSLQVYPVFVSSEPIALSKHFARFKCPAAFEDSLEQLRIEELKETRSYLINTFKPLLDCKLCEIE